MAMNKFININLPEKIITKKYILETNPTDLRQLYHTFYFFDILLKINI